MSGKRIDDLSAYGSSDSDKKLSDIFEVSKNSGTSGSPVYASDGSRQIKLSELAILLGITIDGDYVKRNGTSTLTGDWNTGAKYLLFGDNKGIDSYAANGILYIGVNNSKYIFIGKGTNSTGYINIDDTQASLRYKNASGDDSFLDIIDSNFTFGNAANASILTGNDSIISSTVSLSLNGNNLYNVSNITDAGGLTVVGANARQLLDVGGNVIVDFYSRSGGFGITTNGNYAYSKTTNLTANRIYQYPDAAGTLALAATTLSGYGITDGVTITGIQTLTNKTLTSPIINVTSDATGDVYYRNVGGLFTRLGIGSTNQVLTVISGLPSWQTVTSAPVTSVFGRTGVITATNGDYTTAQVTESGNLYFTNARAIAATLTGYVSGSGTVSSSDSVLSAIEKLNGNIGLVTGAIVFQGLWNASTNSPALASGVGTKGYLYKVSVAGTTSLDGINQWNVGDSVVFDGTVWDKIDGIANEVISVFGRVGAVVGSAADYSGVAMTGITSLNGLVITSNTGVITTGTWNGTILTGTYGGTGINNGASTITVGGNLAFSGAFATTITVTNATTVTLPTTGTLYGTASGSITSAQLATSLADETGTGVAVFGTSPAITTSITTASTTFALLNTTATTVNFAGGASVALNIGNASGINTILGATTFSQAVTISGLTAGSKVFVGASGLLTQDNANFFYDSTNVISYIGSNSAAFAGTRLHAQGTTNASLQNNIINKSNGTLASGDYIATADTGTNTTNFIDFGINGSGNTDAAFTIAGALDGYIYTSDSHMLVGTAAAKSVKFFTGGTLTANNRGSIDSNGNWLVAQGIQTTGSPTAWTVTSAAHTTLAASTEAISSNYNLSAIVQFATGALTTQRAFLIQAPTYTAVGSSTITTAATLAISAAPIASTNVTITNPLAIWVQSGNLGIETGVLSFKDTTWKTAIDVSAATNLRLGNGFANLTTPCAQLACTAAFTLTSSSTMALNSTKATTGTSITIGNTNSTFNSLTSGTPIGTRIQLGTVAPSAGSGTITALSVAGIFSPTGTGTAGFTLLSIDTGAGSITQNSTNTGQITYLDINPTITAMYGTSYGIHIRNYGVGTGNGTNIAIQSDHLGASIFNGDFKLNTAGNGFYVKEGTNATMGTTTLVLGVATVSTTKVTANSRIFITVESLGTVASPVAVSVTARSAGTSFTITSANLTDTSVISWIIIEPA